ncbi:hypothetical protein KO529_01710 [Arenibacter algicola]|uniref:hypothetical protein n=1 Tax=Arenibacter algicola TaxID=616991 RepID=UPI001C074534|nr:hypothetical protein [Arenibacter algicola]MBU2903486.1 hypothetical protein [Arenibacter algicola]
METRPETFYHSYVKEYHEVRATYLKNLLSNIDSVDELLKENELNYAGTRISLTKNTKFIIQADLRQNYFHAIETFFEFFFAFLPNKGVIPDNSKIVRQVVQSNWSGNYKKIGYIANGNMKLNILDKKINFEGHNVTVGQYIFYLGTFSRQKFDKKYFTDVQESIESLKVAIKVLAIDFHNRDEYNSYKHTMRAFPNYQSIKLIDPKTSKEEFEFDLSNSVSYQKYNDKEKETIIKTRLFDPERDCEMTKFCSRLIYNMLELRNIMFNKSSIKNKDEKIAIFLFNKSNITELTKHNVNIQDIAFTTKWSE